jgi:enterochelin esterase family protein
MKKLAILALAVCASATAFAQQALWGGPALVSPEVNADNSVTFRLRAPKAVKVEVTGDFLAPQPMETPYGKFDVPGVAALTEKEGVWEFTTPAPLVSELYSYNFIIDGQRTIDPANTFMIRDVASVTSEFIISGEKGSLGDLYSVNDVPHGTVARRWYDSPGLKEQRRITIYTPPGYEKGKGTYPVFYLLHGSGGDEEAWIALGRTAQILDNLIAQGKAKPMIVVMPNGHTQNNAAPHEGRPYTPAMGGGQRQAVASMEDTFGDIMKFVEANYRVAKGKANRAIAGLSMGGMHSAAISAQYPGTFDYVGVFSAPPVASMRSMGNNAEAAKYAEEFVKKLQTQKAKGYKLYWIACGDTDFLYQGVIESMKKMDEIGFKYVYRESGEGHIWKNWRIYLSEFAPMLFK